MRHAILLVMLSVACATFPTTQPRAKAKTFTDAAKILREVEDVLPRRYGDFTEARWEAVNDALAERIPGHRAKFTSTVHLVERERGAVKVTFLPSETMALGARLRIQTSVIYFGEAEPDAAMIEKGQTISVTATISAVTVSWGGEEVWGMSIEAESDKAPKAR